MRLANVITARGPQIAAVLDDQVVELAETLPDGVRTTDELLLRGAGAPEEAAVALASAAATPISLADVTFAPPVLRPSKILGIGMNYRDHAEEQGIEAPERPLVFAKLPSALAAHEDEVSWSRSLTDQVDWEAELAVVVGQTLRNASPTEAIAGVFGYTAANDVSARDLQFSDGQWVRAKGLDGFLPLGPAIALADEYDPAGKAVASRVNGEPMQNSNTDQLIFGVAEILAHLSASFTLLPGDIVLTGTPAGVGAFRDPPRFLGDGDVVEIEIEGIGTLRNTTRERP
jgi:2-keto-4-pentenoate hydratase/2-oxohepta-3-ene-1,7-dioic acid hydratase in catechol pathway